MIPVTPCDIAAAAARLDHARAAYQAAGARDRGRTYVRYLELRIELLDMQNRHLRQFLAAPGMPWPPGGAGAACPGDAGARRDAAAGGNVVPFPARGRASA
jgi:hypothetical protein